MALAGYVHIFLEHIELKNKEKAEKPAKVSLSLG